MSVRRLVLTVVCVAVGALALDGSPAQATVTHQYLSQITGVPTTAGVAVTGPFGTSRKALAVDGEGDLYVGEKVEESGVSHPWLDEFDSSGNFVRQIGKGVLGNVGSVAVEHESGDIYVVNREELNTGQANEPVDVFSSSGVLLERWEGENTPRGSFVSDQVRVAVDNSTNISDPDAGDVYLSNVQENSVDVFRPEGTGEEKYVEQLNGANTGIPGGSIQGGPGATTTNGVIEGVTVDEADGDVLVYVTGEHARQYVEIFAPKTLGVGYEYVTSVTGTPRGSFETILGFAADGSSGDIYVSVVEKDGGGGVGRVFQFSEVGAYLGEITSPMGGPFEIVGNSGEVLSGLTVAGSGLVYVATQEGVDVYGPTITIPNAALGSVSGLQAHGVTLSGTVDTDSAGNAECRFEYGTSTSYDQSVPCDPATVPSGSGEVAVSVVVPGLSEGTVYHYRLVATNADGDPGRSVDGTFTTLGPVLSGESVTDVRASSATLDARVDPNGAATRYYFEYGTSTSYGSTAPVSPGMEITPAEGVQIVSVHVQGLQPGMVYHYRLIATSVVADGEEVTVERPDHTFTTQPPASEQPVSEEQALPDGRQYELVSPVEKDGTEILGIVGGEGAQRVRGAPGGSAATQVAEDGTSVTYLASSPLGSSPAANTHSTQILSTRGPDGWSSQNIENPQPNIGHFNYDHGEEYRLFSQDLSRAVVQSAGEVDEPPLAPELHQEVYSDAEIYLRNDDSGTFQALLTEQLPQSNEEGTANLEAERAAVEFEGATPDLGHLAFGSDLALKTAPAGLAGVENLYEWSIGGLQLVNVLPNDTVAAGVLGGSVAEESGFGGDERHLPSPLVSSGAISNDGTQVVWGNGADLYSRDMASEETVQLDESQDGGTSGGGVFQAADGEGTRVFFTDKNKLETGAGEGDLYMSEIAVDGAGKLTAELTDLTPGGADGGQVHVLGANKAGTTVYVVAPGVLPSGANAEGVSATAGASNVYVLREAAGGAWSATFIATLTSVDAGAYFKEDIGEGGQHGALAVNMAVRVSSNGRYLAFMSDGSPTEYENRDANSGEPDEEVYLYDTEANRLVCASCNPSGSRPIGEYDNGWSNNEGLPMDPTSTWGGHWIAALIPGGNENQSASRNSTPDSFYQSRVLSNQGRLFFDSADALVPQDVNGVEDVYEYEPPATATEAPANDSCTTGSQTYSVGSGGCVDLISSGKKGGEDSAFVDASANGDDVFFTTADRLVKEDQDSSTDLYDAHACTSEGPCYPTVVAGSPPCTTTESCRAAPVPQPSLFGAPASATFSGSGNVTPTSTPATAVKQKPKTAAQVRAEKLKQALKVCERKAKSKRKGCEAQAKKRYGKAKVSKTKASKSSGRRSK